jgi:hypothetical protein
MNKKTLIINILIAIYSIYGIYINFFINSLENRGDMFIFVIYFFLALFFIFVFIFENPNFKKIKNTKLYTIKGISLYTYKQWLISIFIILNVFSYTYYAKVINVNLGNQKEINITTKVIKLSKGSNKNCWLIGVRDQKGNKYFICTSKNEFYKYKISSNFNLNIYLGSLGIKYYRSKPWENKIVNVEIKK